MKKIIILALACALSSFGCSNQKSLFNGKDLDGWKFYIDDNSVDVKSVFFVKDGVINILGKPFGYMYTAEKYSDFKLTVYELFKHHPSHPLHHRKGRGDSFEFTRIRRNNNPIFRYRN